MLVGFTDVLHLEGESVAHSCSCPTMVFVNNMGKVFRMFFPVLPTDFCRCFVIEVQKLRFHFRYVHFGYDVPVAWQNK